MKKRFKPKIKIIKGDTVAVIAGADKDVKKPRKVIAVYPEENKVLVEGVNIKTKHTKPTAQNTKGGIIKKEASIHISNVMIWDKQTNSVTKIKNERSEEGKLIRISKKSGEVIK